MDASTPSSERTGAQGAEAAPPAGPGEGVMVDIGDGHGALVLYAGIDRVGLEPEIHPVNRPAERQHVWVLERKSPTSDRRFAAVFPSLPAGRYAVCAPDGTPAQEIEVRDGEVTEERWA